ncbi:hypothetical protein OAK47_03050, partial [Planctomycetaceae bacterium]|nr:hypothetical protein [Planctomycetaceae bacterium]
GSSVGPSELLRMVRFDWCRFRRVKILCWGKHTRIIMLDCPLIVRNKYLMTTNKKIKKSELDDHQVAIWKLSDGLLKISFAELASDQAEVHSLLRANRRRIIQKFGDENQPTEGEEN